MKYKIYIHKTTTDGRVYYVGCGQRNRAYDTHQKRRSKDWFSIYENEGLIVEILFETNEEEEALILESKLIQEYKRICDGGTLINKSLFGSSKGKILSDETKKKMSESHK